eukprot:UN00227
MEAEVEEDSFTRTHVVEKDNELYIVGTLSQKLVDKTWDKKRNSAAIDQKLIGGLMKKADKNKDGKLDEKEAAKLCDAFTTKSRLDRKRTNQPSVFKCLDRNKDEYIDRDEFETVMKAMWLMATDDVKLEDMCTLGGRL